MTKLLNFFKSALGRLVIVFVIAGVAGGVALLATHNSAKQYDGARGVADAFAKAVVTCNGTDAKKYFKGFSNAKSLEFFMANCTKGREKLTYDHEVNAMTSKQKGMTVKNVYFDYKLHEQDKPDSHVLVTTAWTTGAPHWIVVNANQAQPKAAPQQQ